MFKQSRIVKRFTEKQLAAQRLERFEQAVYRIGLVAGVFHAFDPIEVAEYHPSEYRGYAEELLRADLPRDRETGEITADTIKAWFNTSRYASYGFVGHPSFEKLCKSLSSAIS